MAEYFFPGGEAFLDEALEGFAQHAEAWINHSTNPQYFTAKHPNPSRKVALISGGGSGHEPLHGGFLGRGMLDGVAPGQIFASPHNRQVYEASKAVAREGGVLHIIKNYTGDKINFGIAAERLRREGINVDRVIVADDVATDLESTATGMRGTGATVFVEKILGAAADKGYTLEQLKALGDELVQNSRSIAVASDALTNVHTNKKAFELDANELEYGVGIHGERAVETITRPSNDDLVETMLTQLSDHLGVESGEQYAVLINNLGSATPLELYSVFRRTKAFLEAKGSTVAGSLVGAYVTALDMRGFSISLLKLKNNDWLDLWNAECDTPAWTVK